MFRRKFIKQVGMIAAGTIVLPYLNPFKIETAIAAAQNLSGLKAGNEYKDDDFWSLIHNAYELSPDFINLENGYLSPQPLSSLNTFTEKIRMINEKPSFYMRRLMEQDLATVKKKVADFAGCTVEELVICRNTTEALNNVILGIELNPQDEILYADMEYPSMKEALEMRAKRFGTKIREIKIPVLPVNDNQVVKIYEEAISEQTKVILISHLVYLTGQVLPVKKICDMAHSKGIEVIVDGAHSFAHLNYKISELNCDYFGCSLHKWLCAPLGTGLLYIKKDKISKVWPLFGDSKAANDSIKKFEHIGTHPISAKLGILAAIDFFNIIGAQRKEDRLRFLKNYWVDKLSALKSVKINTPLKDYQSCAIALLAVKDKTPAELANYLFDKHKIFTVAIDSEQVKGVRVAPNVYTSTADLDKLVEAIKEIAE